MMVKSEQPFDSRNGYYDAVVIGAGLGGLTCATAMAKRGKKVKIIEQNPTPGGYCASFVRKGFKFDAAIHFTVGCGEGGEINRILSSLDIEDDIKFHKIDPLYKVILPGESFVAPADIDSYIKILRERFPDEEDGIKLLFDTMRNIYEDIRKLPSLSPTILKYRDKVFQELMDEYVAERTLKAYISSLFFGGLPPGKISAISKAALIMGTFSQGGFYPEGGGQALVDALVKSLWRYGGELELKTMVTKILVENGRAVGIETAKGERIRSHRIISNASAKHTFMDLIEEKELESIQPFFMDRLRTMEVYLSSFIVYLGVDLDLEALGIENHEILVHETFDIDREFETVFNGGFPGAFYSISIPTFASPALAPSKQHIVSLFTYAPYHLQGKDWNEEKQRLTEVMIRKAEAVIPNLSEHIVVKESATPLTLERFTLNTNGSTGGWAGTPEQVFRKPEPKTPIENLYLTGHWTLPGVGISNVISSGWMVANMIEEEMPERR